MNQNKRDEYLYGISTTGMTMVMTFLIAKISGQFVNYLEAPLDPLIDEKFLAGSFILLTCLVSIVGIILTLSVAHKEFNLPFNFINFVIAIFFVSLPLFISADIINSSLVDPDKNLRFKEITFNYGMILFIISFSFLLIYLVLVYASEETPRSIPIIRYVQIAAFHIAAILFGFICLFIMSRGYDRALMLLSFGAFLCSGFYLYFLWNARTTMQRTMAQNAEATTPTGESTPAAPKAQ